MITYETSKLETRDLDKMSRFNFPMVIDVKQSKNKNENKNKNKNKNKTKQKQTKRIKLKHVMIIFFYLKELVSTELKQQLKL